MSESSGDESYEGIFTPAIDENHAYQGFSFEPQREDYLELWEDEWGAETEGTDGSCDEEDTDTSDGDTDREAGGDGVGGEGGGQGNRLNNTTWCACLNCTLQPTENECVCCHEIFQVADKLKDGENHYACILENPSFVMLTNELVLQTSLMLIHHTRNDPVDFNDPRSMRWAGFKTFIAWVYGRLGRKVRRVIPSCVVTHLRERFPNQEGEEYVGFIDTFMEENED